MEPPKNQIDRAEEQRLRERTLRMLLAKDADRWRLTDGKHLRKPAKIGKRAKRRMAKAAARGRAMRRVGGRKTWLETMNDTARRPRPHPAGARRLMVLRWPDAIEEMRKRDIAPYLPEYTASSVRIALEMNQKSGFIEMCRRKDFGLYVQAWYRLTDAGKAKRSEYRERYGHDMPDDGLEDLI